MLPIRQLMMSAPTVNQSRGADLSAPSIEWKRRILVLDDDPAQRYLLQSQLEKNEYDCQVFENAVPADRWLVANDVDVIVTDHNMPGMTGLQFLDRLRSRGVLCRTPAIVLSGRLDPEFKKLAIHKGAFATLSKPFDFQELAECIQHALTNKVELHEQRTFSADGYPLTRGDSDEDMAN